MNFNQIQFGKFYMLNGKPYLCYRKHEFIQNDTDGPNGYLYGQMIRRVWFIDEKHNHRDIQLQPGISNKEVEAIDLPLVEEYTGEQPLAPNFIIKQWSEQL